MLAISPSTGFMLICLLLLSATGVHAVHSSQCGLLNGIYFRPSGGLHIKVICTTTPRGNNDRPNLRVWKQDDGQVLSVVATRFRNDGLLEEFTIDWGLLGWGNSAFIVLDTTTFRERGDHVWVHISKKKALPALPLDFKPYRAAISQALDFRPPAMCGIPEGAVMVRCLSSHHSSLLLLQEQSLSLVPNVASCLAPRIVTVCLDQISLLSCSILDSVQNCVLLDANIRNRFPQIQLQSDGYNFVTWLKVLLQQEALRVASIVVTFDADVLIFRNVWLLPRIRDWALRASHIKGKDVLFQLDMMNPASWPLKNSVNKVQDRAAFVAAEQALRLDPPGFDEACIVNRYLFNSGQLFLHNSTGVTALYASMHAHKEAILTGKMLEQEYLADGVLRSNLSACSLPHRLFVSWDHVCVSGASRNISFLDIHTFHAAGIREEDKGSIMTMGLAEMKKSLKSPARARSLAAICAYPN